LDVDAICRHSPDIVVCCHIFHRWFLLDGYHRYHMQILRRKNKIQARFVLFSPFFFTINIFLLVEKHKYQYLILASLILVPVSYPGLVNFNEARIRYWY
jgi:hypothetical protein